MSHSSSGSTSSSGSVAVGQVLGVTAPAALGAVAGTTILPVTGNHPLVLAFVILSMTIVALVLVSFVASRIIRKFF